MKLPTSIGVLICGLIVFSGCNRGADSQQLDLYQKIATTSSPDSLRSYVGQARDEIIRLNAAGHSAEARAYLDSLLQVVDRRSPALAPYLKSSLDN